ncbi:MAG: sulfite exporter TauE/SafE family protein [Clostridia bacterium]|nr:sulfite exporter TauE/SafE family protein [Clostridia bacterium]
MKIIWYILAGISGGILGGMGMGGGTLLIPILTIFFNMQQKVAQAINLVSFIPMAIVALIIHFKNKLVKVKESIPIIISGAIFCAIGAFLASKINGDVLRKCFGGFLIILSIIQIFDIKKQKK